MYSHIRQKVQNLTKQFEEIPAERKVILQKIANYIRAKHEKNEPIKLVFICTHNSRRSHFGQIAAALAADFYKIPNVEVFSGGTEATAFHPNAMQAISDFGCSINPKSETSNPKTEIIFGRHKSTVCFSKVYDNDANPKSGFAAIMTCSDAEENCPFVAGTEMRIALTYEDPKKSDGTSGQAATYSGRFLQILLEILFSFSLVHSSSVDHFTNFSKKTK